MPITQSGQACVEISANIDDQTPETLGYALNRALETGALDAWFTPIQMKKNRPAVCFTVLACKEDEARFAEFILRETTTLGVRVRDVRRYIAERSTVTRETEYGPVRFKQKYLNGKLVLERPEYDDLERIAKETNLPLLTISNKVQSLGK